MNIGQYCNLEEGLCYNKIRGYTCGGCGEEAINGKCCDANVMPNPKTQECDCVEPPCKTDDHCAYHDEGSDMLPLFQQCINGQCVDKKPVGCGQCGEKAIDGRCCSSTVRPDKNGNCSCRCKDGTDRGSNGYCHKFWCVTKRIGSTCGGCGKPPINGRCCGKGIEDNVKKPGLCICNIDKS